MPNIHIHYLHHALKRELSALYLSTLIRGLAVGMLALFTPLYFFKEGWSIQLIVTWYIISYALFALTTPIGAYFTGKIGYERTMALSIPPSLVYYALLFYLPTNPHYFWLSAILLGFMKSIFWVPYHAEFAASTDKKDAGEEVGFLRVLMSIVGIISPAVGGFVVASLGFSWIFIIGGILITISIIPMLLVTKKWKPIHIGYKQIMPLIFSKKLTSDLIGHIATGEDLVAQVIWPIWLFLIIPSYTDIGILTTITIFFTFIIMLWIGKLANHKEKAKLIKRSAAAVAFGWVARMFAFSPVAIFFSDSIYKIAGKTLAIPYVALSYTRTTQKHVIQYTAFWMSALAIGKIIAGCLILVAFLFTKNLIVTFFIAALLSSLFLVWKDAIT